MAEKKEAANVRYKATAPARDKEGSLVFSGRTCGVKFEYGVAVFDDYTLKQSRNSTQRSAADIAKIMQDDFHYQVEVVT
jgi:hypothetical protein